jgi:hypothetical protein
MGGGVMDEPEMPGVAMSSGFDDWRPAPALSAEATARVLAKMESVRRARCAAYVSSLTAVIG